MPIWQDLSSIWFTELRGKFFEDDQREGNFAFGYRKMFSSGWNLGVWGGYDLRQTARGSEFGQIAFGVEALSPAWDFRANGYVPTDPSEIVSQSAFSSVAGATLSPTVQLQNNQLFIVSGGQTTTTTLIAETRELALWGFDGEFGLKLPTTLTDLGPNELRVYGGGFYFDNEDLSSALIGPKLRLEWRFDEAVPGWSGSRLTFDASYQWDNVREDRVEAGLHLRLPFDDDSRDLPRRQLTSQERRMSDGLVRDTDVVAVASKSSRSTTRASGAPEVREAVQDAETGTDLQSAVVVLNGSDLQAAITATGMNSLIIAQGGATSFDRIALLDNQTLMGGGSTLQVRGVSSGTTLAYNAPGTRPEIAYAGASAVVTVASNTHVVGLDVTGAGHLVAMSNHGIAGGSSLTNTVIDDVAVSNVGGTAFSFDSNNSAIRIVNSSAFNVTDGIAFQNGNSNILVKNVTIDHTIFDGIVFQANNSDIHVTDNHISNIGDDAIGGMGNNTIEYSRNTFAGNIADNLLDVFLTNGNAYSGSGNVLASGLSLGNRLCNASTPPPFTGSISFTDGTLFQAGVTPCN